MKKNPSILLALGLLILAVGAVLSFSSGPPKAGSAIAAQCRERMKGQGAEMVAKCDEAAFATAMTATDATAAARAISAANNSEIGSNSLAMFLIGIGSVFAALGGLMLWKQNADAR
jgi:type II secretory pathway component PulM